MTDSTVTPRNALSRRIVVPVVLSTSLRSRSPEARSRRGRRAAVAVLAAGALVLGSSTAAQAQPPSPGDSPAQDLATSTRVFEQATSALRLTQARASVARTEVAAAASRATLARARLVASTAAVTRGETAVRAGQAAVVATGAQLSDRQDELGELARALYQQGGPYAQLSVVLSAESAGDLLGRLQTVRTVTEHSAAVISALGEQRAEHRLALARAAAQAEALRQARASAAAQASAAATLSTRAQASAAAASRAVAARTAGVEVARRARDADARLYAQEQAAAAALSARLRGGTAASGVAVLVRPGMLARPVPAATTSPFGMRTNPVTGVYRLHSGLDFGASCGAPIVAAEAGRVLDAGFNPAYGNRTVVQHPDITVEGARRTLATAYNHQSRLGVRPGQDVARGQVIGWVGATGNSTGCHLDFEVMLGGQFVDPAGLV